MGQKILKKYSNLKSFLKTRNTFNFFHPMKKEKLILRKCSELTE